MKLYKVRIHNLDSTKSVDRLLTEELLDLFDDEDGVVCQLDVQDIIELEGILVCTTHNVNTIFEELYD